MADRVSVTMSLGGTLPRNLLVDLEQAIAEDDASTDWEGTAFSRELLTREEPLVLMACEVAWGRFEAIEQFCLVYGLPFVRWSGGCTGSFPPERIVFTGSGDLHYFTASEDDEILISKEDVDRLATIEAIRAHFGKAAFTVPALILADCVADQSEGSRTTTSDSSGDIGSVGR